MSENSGLEKIVSLERLAQFWKKFRVGEQYDEDSAQGEIFNDYVNNVASGSNSHAEGYYTIASGDYSHAEGAGIRGYMIISGEANATTYTYSIWEGAISTDFQLIYNNNFYTIISYDLTNKTITLDRTLSSSAITDATISMFLSGSNTTASGHCSHAEGSATVASGYGSHAEGCYAYTTGTATHAEGAFTRATGYASHAEGYGTKAFGNYSHAEGFSTIASGSYSHVQGQYNIEDTENKYAHIIGNGTHNQGSNAHTIDWEGNAWFAGDIYVGGTSQDDPAAKKLREYTVEEVQNLWNSIVVEEQE